MIFTRKHIVIAVLFTVVVRYILACSLILCGRHTVVSNADAIRNMYCVSADDNHIYYIHVMQFVPLSFVLSFYYT